MTQELNTREEYVKRRDEFRDVKVELLEVIDIHNRAISRLEKQIKDARPKTEHGARRCDDCDCISMKYMGRTPRGGLTGGDDVYECEICNTTKYTGGSV